MNCSLCCRVICSVTLWHSTLVGVEFVLVTIWYSRPSLIRISLIRTLTYPKCRFMDIRGYFGCALNGNHMHSSIHFTNPKISLNPNRLYSGLSVCLSVGRVSHQEFTTYLMLFWFCSLLSASKNAYSFDVSAVSLLPSSGIQNDGEMIQKCA